MDLERTENGGESPRLVDEYVFNEPRCKVCASPHRSAIDRMLADGRAQAEVRRHWNQQLGTEHFTANNVSIHARKHLAAHDDIAREVASMRAARRANTFWAAEAEKPKLRAATEAIIHGGLDAMDAGLTVPEPRDVLAAARVLADLDAADASDRIAALEREMKLL